MFYVLKQITNVHLVCKCVPDLFDNVFVVIYEIYLKIVIILTCVSEWFLLVKCEFGRGPSFVLHN